MNKKYLVVAISNLFVVSSVAAATTDCIGEASDAKTSCVAPTATVYSYGLCDDAASYASTENAWCQAYNKGSYSMGNGCSSPSTATPLNDSTMLSIAQKFVGSNCSVSDNGWGKTISTQYCWSGAPKYNSGILVADFKTISVTCGTSSSTLYGSRGTEVSCPKKYTSKTINGNTVCVATISDSCAAKVGNPVYADNGDKVQTETDFSVGRITFARNYRSTGALIPYLGGEYAQIDRFWRTNFDYKLYVLSNTYAPYAIVFPDGLVQYFDADGSPVMVGESHSGKVQIGSGVYSYVEAGKVISFNANGQATQIKDADGYTVSLTYGDDSSGKWIASNGSSVQLGMLKQVADSDGHSVYFWYNGTPRLTSVSLLSDGTDVLATYGYDSNDSLASVTYADSSVRQYSYNESAYNSGTTQYHALTGIIDENASRFATFTYNSSGRATATYHADSIDKYSITYTSPSSATTVTDPLGAERAYSFSTVNGVTKLTGVSQPGGSGCAAATNAQTYDANGNIASRTDFTGHKSCYAYNTTRNLETARVEGLSSSTSCPSDLTASSVPASPASGSSVTATKTTTKWHDDWDLKIAQAEPKKITYWVYNGQSDPVSGSTLTCAPTDALVLSKPIAVLCKTIEQATTDETGALGFSATATGSARTTSYTYNAYGKILTEDGPRTDVSDITTYTYYAADATCPGAGTSTGMDTGCRGQIQTINNAAGHTTQYTQYNANGQVLTSQDANGVVTTNTYSARGWLLTQTTTGAKTLQSTYSYDSVGQLISLTQSDGSKISYSYDAAHRLTDITDGAGNSIYYTLDAAGNRTKEEVKDASGTLKRTTERVFDTLGRLQNVKVQ